MKDKNIKNVDLEFLKMITYGGDTMEYQDEIAVNEFLKAHNCNSKITKGHGMSETCGCASFAIDDYNIPRTMGIPMPSMTYGIVDPETKKLIKFEDGQDEIEGELIISGPTVTSGVLDGKVIVPHYEYDGMDFILTRDIAKMNRDGIMEFLERKDRSFTRFDGFKVKPHELENMLKQDSRIKYCVVSPYFDEEKMGNILSTTWTQESGFNVALPQISGQYPPAGCATIAMAQVMKYNEYPTFFNWNSMPNSYASSVTAAFIRDVADAINADYALDGTSASLSDVRNALVSKYGYSTTAQVVNHSAARTIGNLRKKQPVIMQGFTDDGKVGHAWVACGYHDIDHYTEYELLTMPEEFHPGGTFVFLISDSYTTDFDIRTYFYMNWGWGGSYNGMYLDTNLYLERSDGSFSWNRNRKDIVDIVPK